MSRQENTDGKVERPKEGDKSSAISSHVASEAVSEDPQAKPRTKFSTFSGTDDKMLVAVKDGETPEQHRARQDAALHVGKTIGKQVSEFVLEDKAKGVEHVAAGERSIQPEPRKSFIEGLKKFVGGAKNPQEEAELQSQFSIEYMMRKMKDFVSATQTALGTQSFAKDAIGADAAAPVAGSSNPDVAPQHKSRSVDAMETVRQLRSDDSRAVIAGGDDAGIMELLHRINEKAETPPPPEKRTLNDKALECAAHGLHDALNNKGFLNLPAPDAEKVLQILGTITPTDRTYLLNAYSRIYEEDFRTAAIDKCEGKDELRIKSVIDRRDRQADDFASIELSLEILARDREPRVRPDVERTEEESPADAASRRFAEKQLRETIGSLSPDALGRLMNQYTDSEQHKHHDLGEDLLKNPRISPATKEALAIYLQHGSKLTDADVSALADIGLKHKDIDIFEEAFLNASDTVRASYRGDLRQHQIKTAFADVPGGAQPAIDFVETKGIRTLTLVQGDVKFLHTDREHITFALQHATEDERNTFRQGLSTAIQNSVRESQGDTSAKPEPNQTYKDFHDVLSRGAGTPRELAMWEAQLSRGGGLIVDLTSLHKDGWGIPHTPIHAEGEHNFHKVLQTANNMSESEWNALKNDPTYRVQLDLALRTFLTYKMEYEPVKELIDAKLNAPTYEASKQQNIDSLRLDYNEKTANRDQRPPLDTSHPLQSLQDFITGKGNVTEEDVRTLLTDEKIDVSKLKNDYAAATNRDLSSDLLPKIDSGGRLEFSRLLTPGYQNPRQALYDYRYQEYQQQSAYGDRLLTDWYSASDTGAEATLKTLYGRVQKDSEQIESLSPEELSEYQNCLLTADGANKIYVGSKRELSEEFVNYSLGIAAFGGSFVTGGGSWELYATMMVAGGGFKVVAKSQIEGGSYRKDRAFGDLGSGVVGTGTSLLGPEMLGVTRLAAGATARSVLAGEAGYFVKNYSEKQLADSLETIAKDALKKPLNESDAFAKAEIEKLAGQIATKGHEAEVAKVLEESLKNNLMIGSSEFLKRSIYEYTLVSGTGGAAGGINAFSEAMFDGDYKKFADRTLRGFIDGYVSSSVLHALFHGAVTIKRAHAGEFRGESVASTHVGGVEVQSKDGFNWASADGKVHFTGSIVRTPAGNVELKTAHGDFVVDSASGNTIFISKDGKVHRINSSYERPDTEPGARRPETEAIVTPRPESRRPPDAEKIEANKQLHDILNFEKGDPITFNGEHYTYVRFDGEDVILNREAVYPYGRMDLLAKGFSNQQIDALKGKKDIELYSRCYYDIKRVEGSYPNEVFHLANSEGADRKVRLDSLLLQHPDAILLPKAKLLDSHGDASVAALQRGTIVPGDLELSAENRERFAKRGWTTGKCVDQETGRETPVAIRPVTDDTSRTRMQNEIKAQWFFKDLGLETEFAPTALRELEIGGRTQLVAVQEYRGTTLQNALAKITSEKLYNGKEQLASTSLTPEELQLILMPEQDVSTLHSQLKRRAEARGDADLLKAEKRLASIAADEGLLDRLKTDPELQKLRKQYEQSLVARHIFGDFDDHTQNFVVMDETGQIRCIDLDMVQKKPSVVLAHAPDVKLLKNDIFDIIERKPLSPETVARLREWTNDGSTPARMRALGFNDREIESILARARLYLSWQTFPEVHR
jgi:hypothetical protein